MSTNIPSLILNYYTDPAESSTMEDREVLRSFLADCFGKFAFKIELTWKEIKPKPLYDENGLCIGSTHTRSVYKSPQWVIKIDTAQSRNVKLLDYLPHAEEIAYKISKLFGWRTVPKTKTIHQDDISSPKTAAYYFELMKPFIDETGKLPITCTLQGFIKGDTLPSEVEIHTGQKEKPQVKLDTYQEAFLLEMILGKGDSRGDNFMRTKTGVIRSIDNEYIGLGTKYDGILNQYQTEKEQPINQRILRDVMRVKQDQIESIQAKYTARDSQLAHLWEEEPASLRYPKLKDISKEKWTIIGANIAMIKQAISTLKQTDQIVTLTRLEDTIEQAKKKAHQDKLAAALIAQRKAREAREVRMKVEAERQELAWEKEKSKPPIPSSNMLQDIHQWIQMGYCLVLHSGSKNPHIYYQGKESSVENVKIISVDVAPSTQLLTPWQWPGFLERRGVKVALKKIADQITQLKLQPRELHAFKFGYS